MIYTVLLITLAISLYTDIRERRILNKVTLPATIAGFIFYSFDLGLQGLLYSLTGFVVGFLMLLIPYLLGGMGAGDVKLMAAIGALTGAAFTLQSFFYTAIIGGIISAILILKNRGIWRKAGSPKNREPITFPYGVPIVLGTLCAFIV
ncbi:A24 family peptidase [Robertmurraya korlensis]|uniref:A24 family peptidase n=1 Tax=Robertmurraya korlensis TaxID=519977 RepID=UPI00203BC07D|nr:A24 family peptidase [Robertmurraya korlensis]MCM3602697.1 A24 family peptidase [Robertmurraya korlensis]